MSTLHNLYISTRAELLNLGDGQLVVLFALLILLGSRKMPELARGLAEGLFAFRDSTKRGWNELNEQANDAGRSVGGIYGKRAAQAITPDNQVAELYAPAAFRRRLKPQKRRHPGKLLATTLRRLGQLVQLILHVFRVSRRT